MAFSLAVILITIWGYMIAVIGTGQAYIYAMIKQYRETYASAEKKLHGEKSDNTDESKRGVS
jgi:hypothetical protein